MLFLPFLKEAGKGFNVINGAVTPLAFWCLCLSARQNNYMKPSVISMVPKSFVNGYDQLKFR